MFTALPPIDMIAQMLGGEVAGAGVLCPGPGHSDDDRSLSIKLDSADREGFVTYSFAGDDWKDCRDHVRKKLGLPEPTQSKKKPQPKPNGGGAPWTTLGTYIYRDADKKPYLRVQKKLDDKGKRRFVQSSWRDDSWVKGAPSPKIPYLLPELEAAPKTATVFWTEGEKDANTVTKIGFTATTMSEGSSAEWDEALTPYFKDRTVVVLADADVPGRKYAQRVAGAIRSVAASVKLIDLYPERDDGSDVTDWIAEDTAGVELAKLVKAADEWESEPPADDDEEPSSAEIAIGKLAQLTLLEYELARKDVAKALDIRPTILDELVQAERKRLGLNGGDDGRRLQGRAIELPEPKPWPEVVDGVALLDAIVKAIQTYIVLPEHAARSCAVWTVYTFLAEHFQISPRLCISSPVMGCGKSTLTDIISRLVLRPLKASNATAAAIFRVIEMLMPTLMIDEGDSFVELDESLRGILNSGHRKDGAVLRVVGEDLEPRQFATFSPCSIALIGELPATLADRSIPINLKRLSAADGKVASFSPDEAGNLDLLARQSARWAEDNAVEIAATKPDMPDGIINRARDNWRPLKAIATVVGGLWPGYIDAAALAAQSRAGDETSELEQLLSDIRDVFTDDETASASLVQRLIELESRWGEMRGGKPLTQNKLARMLKPLGIAPEPIGPEDNRLRGYRLEHFQEAFDRYLSPQGSAQPSIRPERDEMGTSDIFEPSSAKTGWTDGKSKKPNNEGPLDGWTVAEGGPGQKATVCAHCGRPGDLVEVSWSDATALLHRECEEPYRRVLDGFDEPASSSSRVPAFRVIAPAEPDAVCIHCYRAEGEVLRIVGPEAGSKSETLHLGCAAEWFDGLRKFELPTDDNEDDDALRQ